MEKVSIVIPVYNVESELPLCLESVLNQTYTNVEIIVVNDGSTDRSAKIISQYADGDSRVVVVNQENQGVSAARNHGIEKATGDFIAFVDGDDWVENGFIEHMLTCMKKTNADIVECGYKQILNPCDISYSVFPREYGNIHGAENIIEKHLKGEIAVLVWNKLYRTEQVKAVFFKEGTEYEDVLWTFNVLKKTNSIVGISDLLYNWRERPGSISRRQFNEKRFCALDRFSDRAKEIEQMFSGGGKRPCKSTDCC